MTVPKPRFDARVSLGNALTIAAMVASVGVSFVVTSERAENNAEDIRELRQAATVMETRLRLTETVQGQIRTQIDGLSASVNEIKDSQKEITALMRQLIMEVKR